jgi:hypothetical protein
MKNKFWFHFLFGYGSKHLDLVPIWVLSKYLTWKLAIVTSVVWFFVGLAYQGKDIVFRFNIEYSRLRDFGP